MKHLILIFCIGLQLLLVPSAQAWSQLAWSSLDINRSFSGNFSGNKEQCQFVIAGSDDGEGSNNEEDSEEEEEEEPDCD
jgi:hypothetical protein